MHTHLKLLAVAHELRLAVERVENGVGQERALAGEIVQPLARVGRQLLDLVAVLSKKSARAGAV
jgi:hypothetical protein